MEPAAVVERLLPAFSAARRGDWFALEAAVRGAGVPARLAAEVITFVPIALSGRSKTERNPTTKEEKSECRIL